MDHLGVLTQEQYNELTEWQRMDRRIKELEKQNKYLNEAWRDKNDQVNSLNAAIDALNDFSTGHHYTWVPYAENHLETLSCAIVIPAEWMRQLINEAKESKPAFINNADDTNQLTMAIDNDVVIVNTFQMRD